MGAKREKFYTVSARLVFSGLMVALILVLILSLSSVVNHGPILPLFGIGGTTITTTITNTGNGSGLPGSPIIVEATCAPFYTFQCEHPYFNVTTGVFTVALSQNTSYNWILVTVRFVPSNTTYSNGVPELSWSPPNAVNVSGGLLSNVTKYINIPIASGPVAVGTNITGTIWAKYQLGVGKAQFYAEMSSAVIQVKRSP